jgi:tocopherol O-methyltransferase
VITPRCDITPAQVADHYDELDRFYRRVWGEHVHHGLWLSGDETAGEATRNLIACVAAALEIGESARVCDVGCGYGGTARALAADFGAHVTGVTVSRAQADYAGGFGTGENPRILCMDFQQNDFRDGEFDAALAIESTEHFADKPRLFSELNRIVRPGGRVAVCAWLAREDAQPWELRYLLEPICREGRLPGMGSENEYRGLLEGAGFEETRFEDLSRCVERTWPVIVTRVLQRLLWDGDTWRFLLGRPRNAVFALTILRITAAYRSGAMRYGLFSARKGGE